ncbi:MAG: superoxide dismutase [Patescibacteria group bacterium]
MPINEKKFDDSIFNLKGISKKTIENHLKLYQGYVNKYNEISKKLSDLKDSDYSEANQVYSYIRELKIELSFAWGGVINHEIYFGHLGTHKGTTNDRVPDGALSTQIKKDFGSIEEYYMDLKASGMAARGWVWTVWNIREKKLYNHVGDAQNSFLVWEMLPILALDTYEHAYFIDYGTMRASYIDSFIQNINWETVSNSFKTVISYT